MLNWQEKELQDTLRTMLPEHFTIIKHSILQNRLQVDITQIDSESYSGCQYFLPLASLFCFTLAAHMSLKGASRREGGVSNKLDVSWSESDTVRSASSLRRHLFPPDTHKLVQLRKPAAESAVRGEWVWGSRPKWQNKWRRQMKTM